MDWLLCGGGRQWPCFLVVRLMSVAENSSHFSAMEGTNSYMYSHSPTKGTLHLCGSNASIR